MKRIHEIETGTQSEKRGISRTGLVEVTNGNVGQLRVLCDDLF